MTSAVLASQNESLWGERKVYARKYPNAAANVSNSKDKSNAVSTPNSNKQIRAPSTDVLHLSDAPSPADLQLKETSRAAHVKFSLDTYTIRELKNLKKRLLTELQQVRLLRTRLESARFHSQPICPPPPAAAAHSNRLPKTKKKVTPSKRRNPKQKLPVTGSLLRSCSQILTKLMNHKYGWVFNSPVDVVSLGLHDYNDVIKTPMDLGTVKSKLGNQLYGTVLDFASDVRLTFNNAMKYNPKGHDVYVMSETLLAVFERMFKPVGRQFCEVSVAEGSSLTGKVTKPKAKDTKKREMSFEEKTVLGRSLVELPQEKMALLFSLLNKRKSRVAQDGDVIELDIEAIDNETLWELDRFVSNFKKGGSKSKKHGVVGGGEGEKVTVSTDSEVVEVDAAAAERLREEDVDIGEEIPVENYSPVVIERDVSSSSDSSSSDSGISSGAESDDDGNNDNDCAIKLLEAKDVHGT